jgi:uncharacterized MAPEG superfamily protein
MRQDLARELADIAGQIASLKGEANSWLRDPNYNTLKLRLEIAHSAAEAAAVEARRRVRLNEGRWQRRGRANLTIELRVLTLSVVLGVAQIIATSHAASLQRGYRWTASSRDQQASPLRGVAGRLDRALHTFLETFPLFVAVVLVAHVSGPHNALTEWGALLYLGARVAYVLLYAAGVPLIRSLVWNVATAGILLFVVALFLE